MIDPYGLYASHARDAGLRRLLAMVVRQELERSRWVQRATIESAPYCLRIVLWVPWWWWLGLGLAHYLLARHARARVEEQCRRLRLVPAKIVIETRKKR